jgi:hypothetical protein
MRTPIKDEGKNDPDHGSGAGHQHQFLCDECRSTVGSSLIQERSLRLKVESAPLT